MNNVFKIRIIADMDERVKEEVKRENISADKALYILQKDDEERRKWGLQIYGTDTWDSKLYDMVIHIDNLTVDDAVDIIAEVVKKPAFQATEQSRNLVDNLALAAKVRACLIQIAPNILIKADAGKIYICTIENCFSADEANRIKSAVTVGKVEKRHASLCL